MNMTEDARIALAAKGAAEHDLAHIAVCPPWRHAVFAVLMGVWITAPAVPMPARFGLFGIIIAAVLLIVRSDRRRLGVFVNGYRRGKTRLVMLPLLAVMMALYAASTYFGDLHGKWAVSVILGLIALPIGYLGSVLWQRVFVRELGR